MHGWRLRPFSYILHPGSFLFAKLQSMFMFYTLFSSSVFFLFRVGFLRHFSFSARATPWNVTMCGTVPVPLDVACFDTFTLHPVAALFFPTPDLSPPDKGMHCI